MLAAAEAPCMPAVLSEGKREGGHCCTAECDSPLTRTASLFRMGGLFSASQPVQTINHQLCAELMSAQEKSPDPDLPNHRVQLYKRNDDTALELLDQVLANPSNSPELRDPLHALLLHFWNTKSFFKLQSVIKKIHTTPCKVQEGFSGQFGEPTKDRSLAQDVEYATTGLKSLVEGPALARAYTNNPPCEERFKKDILPLVQAARSASAANDLQSSNSNVFSCPDQYGIKRCHGFTVRSDPNPKVYLMFTGSGYKLDVWRYTNFDMVMTQLPLTYGNPNNAPGLCAHRGFLNMHEFLWPCIRKHVEEHLGSDTSKAQLFCVGHSLGGALATLSVVRASTSESWHSVAGSTLAAPGVFNKKAAEVLSESVFSKHSVILYQFYDATSDPFPKLPWNTQHVGYRYPFTHWGLPHVLSSYDWMRTNPWDAHWQPPPLDPPATAITPDTEAREAIGGSPF